MCCCAGELQRKPGTPRQQGGKSPPGSENTHMGLSALRTDLVFPQVEVGHGFVALEGLSESLAHKGNREAKVQKAPQTPTVALAPLLPILLSAKSTEVIVPVFFKASESAWRKSAARRQGNGTLGASCVPLPTEPPPRPGAPGQNGADQSRSEQPYNQCLPESCCVHALSCPHLQLLEGRMAADGLRPAHENLTATQAARMLGGYVWMDMHGSPARCSSTLRLKCCSKFRGSRN